MDVDREIGNSAENCDETDYETDEEALVHVTIAGTLQEDLRNLKPSEFSFIDIDREKPLVVIGNQIFSGEYQDSVGTSVFFTQSENSKHHDKVFNRHCSKSVDYFNSTRKKLVLKRVFLNKKSKTGQEPNSGQDSKGNNQVRDSEGKK